MHASNVVLPAPDGAEDGRYPLTGVRRRFESELPLVIRMSNRSTLSLMTGLLASPRLRVEACCWPWQACSCGLQLPVRRWPTDMIARRAAPQSSPADSRVNMANGVVWVSPGILPATTIVAPNSENAPHEPQEQARQQTPVGERQGDRKEDPNRPGPKSPGRAFENRVYLGQRDGECPDLQAALTRWRRPTQPLPT